MRKQEKKQTFLKKKQTAINGVSSKNNAGKKQKQSTNLPWQMPGQRMPGQCLWKMSLWWHSVYGGTTGRNATINQVAQHKTKTTINLPLITLCLLRDVSCKKIKEKQQQQLARAQQKTKNNNQPTCMTNSACSWQRIKRKTRINWGMQKNNNQQSTYLANKWLDTSCLLLGCRGKQKKKKIKN